MSFDVSADAYDRYMGTWSRLLADPFVEFAGVRSGQRVLDVGCGPGALTEALARRTQHGSVSAVDPSPSFVTAVRARVPGADVRTGWAEDLPFAPAAFDVTLAQLVVHFMADPVAGLAEMARVTVEGGTVAACVWDFGGGRGPLGPFWESARELDPNVVDESHLAGTRKGHLAALFAEAGLSNIDEDTLEVGRSYPSFEDWWEPFNSGVGPGGAYLRVLEPARAVELRERCRGRLPQGRFSLTASAWAVRGRPSRQDR